MYKDEYLQITLTTEPTDKGEQCISYVNQDKWPNCTLESPQLILSIGRASGCRVNYFIIKHLVK